MASCQVTRLPSVMRSVLRSASSPGRTRSSGPSSPGRTFVAATAAAIAASTTDQSRITSELAKTIIALLRYTRLRNFETSVRPFASAQGDGEVGEQCCAPSCKLAARESTVERGEGPQQMR